MNPIKFPVKKILILVCLLALPGFLYWMLTEKGKNRYRSLPFFGPKQVASTFHKVRGKQIPDTLYHTIRDFKLMDHKGGEFRFPADTNVITVFSFFYTRCQTFCPKMNQQIQFLAQKYGNNRMLQFVSVSVDPGFDQPEVLATYKKSLSLKSNKWTFITGDQQFIFDLSRKDFLLDAMIDPQDAQNIIHSSKLILVDPKKRIRGYYDALSKEQMDKLNDEVKVLIAEELRKIKAEF